MTTLPLFGGPSKRDIIQLAFEDCGQAGYEFELTAEEYNSALRRLDAMMSEWLAMYGIDLSYNFPLNGTNGSADDESGIPDGTISAVYTALARRIAPGIGKTLGAEANLTFANSITALRSKYGTIPSMMLGRQTVRGAGNRYYGGWRSPYFFTPIPDDEIIQ